MEYLNISFDQRPESATPVTHVKHELAGLSPAEVEELIYKEKSEVLNRWQDSRERVEQLFEQLNADKDGFGRDTFEIQIGSRLRDGHRIDTSIRVTNFRKWKAEGVYNFHYIRRMDDGTADYSDPSWGLGRDFTFQYGNLNKRTVQLEIVGDGDERDIVFTRFDGRPLGEPQPHDTAIFLTALREAVVPKLDKTAQAIEQITAALEK